MTIPFFPPASAFSGHAPMQVSHPMQRAPVQCTWGFMRMPSGLWHQTQRRGHPLKKTVLLIPGPSSVDMRWILRIVPFIVTPTAPRG
jgi:hypothetical protein